MINILKTTLILVFLSIGNNSLAKAQEDDSMTRQGFSWPFVENKELHFLVAFPEQPEYSLDTINTGDGELYSHEWTCQINHDNGSASIFSFESDFYPAEFIHSDSTEELVNGFINSYLTELIDDPDYTLLSSKYTDIMNYPGKIFKISYLNNQVILEYRIYLVKNMLYSISVVCPVEHSFSQTNETFFNSFELNGLEENPGKESQAVQKCAYSVDFPGIPQEKNEILDSDFGKLHARIKLFRPEVQDSAALFLVGETIYPEDPGYADDYRINAFLFSIIETAMLQINGEFISIKDLKVQGYPAREVKAYMLGGQAIVTYIYIYAGKNIFSIGVMSPPEYDESYKMRKFFNSFKIIE